MGFTSQTAPRGSRAPLNGTRGLPRRIGAAIALVVVAGVVTACTAGSGSEGPVEEIRDLPARAQEVMDQPQYANGRWMIAVTDLETGDVLIDVDSERMTEPASFTKTYSVGAAWLKWGPDHRVTTPVKQSGDVVDGTLEGDLVLVGKGDLTMGGRTKADGTVDFANLDHNDANPIPGATLTSEDPLAGLNVLAEQVRASGITGVSGRVVVDDRLFQGTLENQPITPIIINQNLIDVVVAPAGVGEPAQVRMSPVVSPWRVINEVETVAAGGETAIAAPESGAPGEIVVRGTIAADADEQLKVFTLTDPSTFARTAFIEALERAGVSVAADRVTPNDSASLPDAAAVDALPSVAELESLPLEEEATYVMKISYNRGAQTLVCLLAVDAGADACDAGLGVAAEIWRDAGLDTTGASLVDGSGLNGNFVTPANAVQTQMIMAERPDGDRWKDTMPILGVDGSLADVQKDSPAAGKVHAKTGTLVDGDAFNGRLRLNTKALGGVMQSESGRDLAFMIVLNQGFSDGIDGVLQANDDVGAVAAALQQDY